MIKSMTGFGRKSFLDENLNLDIEIKSVNSRYSDINIRMPHQLNFLEDKINKLAKQYIKRGRVDIFIRTKKANLSTSKISLDLDQASLMYDSLLEISKKTGLDKDSIQMADILKNEDVLRFESQDLDEDYLHDTILNLIKEALEDLVSMRQEEGLNLYNHLKENLSDLENLNSKLKDFSDDVKEELKNKIEKSISDQLSKSQVDMDRIAGEIVFYADRQDINEEITRMDSHISQFNSQLDSNKPVGKKLDFISQEMLREANTIGSKSQKIELIDIVIDMKTLIEKIKEQVQNIE